MENIMKMLIGVVVSTVVSLAHASDVIESTKKIICTDTDSLSELLAKEFKEVPVFSGFNEEEGQTYILTLNAKTGTWTMIQGNKKISCVIGVGVNGKMRSVNTVRINHVH